MVNSRWLMKRQCFSINQFRFSIDFIDVSKRLFFYWNEVFQIKSKNKKRKRVFRMCSPWSRVPVWPVHPNPLYALNQQQQTPQSIFSLLFKIFFFSSTNFSIFYFRCLFGVTKQKRHCTDE